MFNRFSDGLLHDIVHEDMFFKKSQSKRRMSFHFRPGGPFRKT